LHAPAVAGAHNVTGPVEDTLLLSEVEQPPPVEAQPEWADRAVLGALREWLPTDRSSAKEGVRSGKVLCSAIQGLP
jgi:hypothetical protein